VGAAPQTEHRHPIFARWWALTGSGAMSKRDRAELLAGLSGRVLEVGVGDGLNFPFYPDTVAAVVAVEPEPSLRARAERRAAETPERGITVVAGTAEALPVEDASVDAVVTCLVLCSVRDQARALAEARRVLRPGGELRFYEHVVSRTRGGLALQRALDRSGIWPLVGAGCHLTNDTEASIRATAGLQVERLRRFGVGPGPVAVPHIAGVARRA
jgi:ubiquinone/menaquinone biosynthesis C-methylase UbiE